MSATTDLDLLLTPTRPFETVTAEVVEATPDIAVVRLGDGRSATLPASEFYPNRRWSVGSRYTLALLDGGPRPVVSAAHPDLIALLLSGLSPEIRSGAVRVMGVARQVGIRSKVAVAATEPGIDPIGAALGKGANRIKTLSAMLLGERVDVVSYHPDPAVFAVNALAVRSVSASVDEQGQVVVSVPQHQLEAARGGGGLNVALAARLIGRRIAVTGA